MANETVKVSTGNIGFCGLLALVFITLKLCKVIAWSWWWVLAPIWIPLAFALGIALICGIVALVCLIGVKLFNR